MSQDWYLIKTPNQQVSGYESDYMTDFGTDSFTELLNTYVGDDITLYDSSFTAISTIKGIIQDKTYNNSLKKNERILLLPLNTCIIGEYVKYKDLYWMIITFVDDNKMYQKSIMQLCNWTLKHQDQSTGEIISTPCITSSTRIDEKTGQAMTLGDNRKSIKVPYNQSTILLRNDDSKTWRFFLDRHPTNPSPYHIVGVDTTTYNYGGNGLIEILVEQDELQDNDRPDLGVCDYFIKTTTTVTGAHSIIICNNPTNELILGSDYYITLSSVQYDAYNNVVTGITPVWAFEYPQGYNSDSFTITYEGKLSKIKVKRINDLVGKVLKVTVSNGTNGYIGKLDLTIRL